MSEHPRVVASSGVPDFFDILRKTLLVGGGALANMVIGLVRNKFVAIWLGPAGIALTGIFSQLIEIIGATFSLGLATSGVRQIASCVSSGDNERLARIVKTIRRIVWFTGLSGALFMLLASRKIALITFGEADYEKYIFTIGCLGIAVLCRALFSGQGCLIQGTRRVSDFMWISVGSALLGLLVGVPCYYWLGMQGVAVAVILGYASTLIITWLFSRRVPISDVPCSIAESRKEARLLIAFGLPIMFSGLVNAFSPYAERVLLLRCLGIEVVGQYQAAFSLAGVAVTFVLAAMAADYYPKLVAHAEDTERFNQEINAQVEVALLLSIPILVWLAVLSQRVAILLYSPAFVDSGAILRIMTIGVIGRILSAPLRLALYAKGKGKTIFAVEAISALVSFALIYLMASRLGLIGCGWAFALLHLLVAALLVIMLPVLIGQTVSRANLLLVGWSLVVLLGLWINHAYTSVGWIRITLAALLATLATILSARSLVVRITGNIKTRAQMT